MKKADAIQQWKGLPDNLSILDKMTPVPYKATGSRYGACGIRIDGNPEFINAVLSRLKDIIAGENHVTRLELARNVVDGSKLGKDFPNSDNGAEVCYIRLHMRSELGARVSSFFDRELELPTKQYAQAIGSQY